VNSGAAPLPPVFGSSFFSSFLASSFFSSTFGAGAGAGAGAAFGARAGAGAGAGTGAGAGGRNGRGLRRLLNDPALAANVELLSDLTGLATLIGRLIDLRYGRGGNERQCQG